MNEYFKLGKIVAAHGLKGELVLKHVLGKKTSLEDLQAVFTEEKKNSFLPWFIQSSKTKSPVEIFLKLEGIDDRETALKFIQKDLWIPAIDFKKLAAKNSPANFLGYTIKNENKILGEILEVIEQQHQLLFRLEIQHKEVLIPINDETLKKVDHKKKEVQVKLPDGLLEIYL